MHVESVNEHDARFELECHRQKHYYGQFRPKKVITCYFYRGHRGFLVMVVVACRRTL